MPQTHARFAPLHWVFVPTTSQDGKDIASLDESWFNEELDVDVSAEVDVGLDVDVALGGNDWTVDSDLERWDPEPDGHQDVLVIGSHNPVDVRRAMDVGVGGRGRGWTVESDLGGWDPEPDGHQDLFVIGSDEPVLVNTAVSYPTSDDDLVKAHKESRERLELRIPKRPRANRDVRVDAHQLYPTPDTNDEPKHTFHLRYSHASATKPHALSTSRPKKTSPLARAASNTAAAAAAFPKDVVQAFLGRRDAQDGLACGGEICGDVQGDARLRPTATRPAKRAKDVTATAANVSTHTQPRSKLARPLLPSSSPSASASASLCSLPDPDADVDTATATATAPTPKAQPRRRLVPHAYATPQLDCDEDEGLGGRLDQDQEQKQDRTTRHAPTKPSSKLGTGTGTGTGTHVSSRRAPALVPQANLIHHNRALTQDAHIWSRAGRGRFVVLGGWGVGKGGRSWNGERGGKRS
ncbi:hypothetical protein M427DRAFT_66863 [Gonapodya prolifera JEL478]|uniref:Uncharacterized protein n=1 Tax=Gonapodya prolifera (strain JEL478) TaxID=1344416 RepID=A0A139ASI0_GONPJ|nr:hypothetical protein M427DRAFT_66863 [Gonapodya prolifera JEL478]|eukprot:KXS19702.1 hypothetical protein M427DRAFT_66863 [Gonapodya prolifera JEL478]